MKLALKIGAAAVIIGGAAWVLRTPLSETSVGRALSRETSSAESEAPESSSVSPFHDEQHPAQKDTPGSVAKLTPQSEAVLEKAIAGLLKDVAQDRLPLESDEAEFETLDLAQTDAVPVIVRLWANKDRAAATKWTASLPESEVKSASMRQIAIGVAKADREAADEWLHDLAPGPSRDAAIESLASELSSSDPQRAAKLAEEMSEGASREQTITHALSQWAAEDPAGAAQRAREFDEVGIRSSAVAAVAIAWADRDPAAAGKLAVESITDPAAQMRAVVSIVQRWAEADPAAASNWVAKFAPGPLSDNSVEQLVTLWARRGVDAPSRWIGSLTDIPKRDVGYATLARTLQPSDSNKAQQLASQISDQTRRNACLQTLKNR